MKNLRGKILLAYVAGIIDGEGSITLKKHSPKGHTRYQLWVTVSNTNEWLLKMLKFNFGGQICPLSYMINKPNWRQAWRWQIQCTQAYTFLKLILPYLQLKRPQAELAIDFQNRRNKKHHLDDSLAVDEAQKILMSKYNQRGKNSDLALEAR